MDLGIAGRVALVTASSKGLGRASALALGAEGCRVVVCARGEKALRSTETELRSMDVECLALVEDVTEPGAPQRLVDATVERFGGLHIVVANAGGPSPSRALDVDEAGLDGALNANLKTSIRLVQSALPHLRSAGWGRVCLITSVSVRQPIPTLALSNTARTGLWAWAKTAAADLFPEGITVNLVCPGSHATDRMKQLGGAGPMGDPGDFGRCVAFLCSEPAAFVSGIAFGVDGAAVAGLL